MTGPVQRALAAGMLGLQSVVLLLTTPVMLSLTDVGTAPALLIGLGLTVACLVAAGLMRTRAGVLLGWGVQVASVLLGFVVPVMFALGVVFLALYAGAAALGGKVDRERAERAAESSHPVPD